MFRSNRPDMFCKKCILRNFAKFTGKHLYQCFFFQQRPANLLKQRLWQRCFPVNFAKFLRTPIVIEHLPWLFLNFRPSRNRDRDLDHQIDILNNLDLKGMDICSKSNFFKMERSELLKLKIKLKIKPADKRAQQQFFLLNIIVIYLCIHGKYNLWDYVAMTRDVRLFKVCRACFPHHKSIVFTLEKHKLSAHTPTHSLHY